MSTVPGACQAAAAGPAPCSPETGCGGHVERRRATGAPRRHGVLRVRGHTSERMVERISERTQTVDAAVPHVLEELQERISERMHEQTVDQPGDEECRDPADLLHRQGCRYACGDETTGPSDSDIIEDGSPADAVRRQGACGHADAPVPHDALKERISERVHEQTVDQPGDQAGRDTADSLHQQGCRYA